MFLLLIALGLARKNVPLALQAQTLTPVRFEGSAHGANGRHARDGQGRRNYTHEVVASLGTLPELTWVDLKTEAARESLRSLIEMKRFTGSRPVKWCKLGSSVLLSN